MREVPPVEREFAISMALLVCAYHWRAGDPGPHRPDEPCATCWRLVREDLHAAIGHLLFSAYVHGRDEGEEREWSVPEGLAYDELVAVLSKRGAEICRERRARVVASDPRTFESASQAAEGGG